MSAKTLTQSDLIFPTQTVSFSSTLNSLKRSALSITNRLNSITSDSEFVTSVAEAYGLPLVANERCGSWYIPLDKKEEGVYFKSTDGHMNEWSFNMRRLNYQLLDVVGKSGGCIVVDSTRRGKSMPDALSKTIPIWCSVMNRALFPDHAAAHDLHTSPQAVSASEHAQIEKRLGRFVQEFLDICKPDISNLRSKLQKPLRPIWVTQGSSLPEAPPSFTDFHAIVLCTASRRVHGGEVSEGGYIQGAADDHEAWSHGLTPTVFWSNKDMLLNTNEDDLPKLIRKLVSEEKGPDAAPMLIKPTETFYVSSSQNLDIEPFDVIISCTPKPLTTTNSAHLKTKKYLHLICQAHKLGARDLRTQLSRLEPFLLSISELPKSKVLVCCPTGKDLSLGVALAILCLHFRDDGEFENSETKEDKRKMDKNFIKQRITWVTTAAVGLNPSRETLKSVNSFLMPDPSTLNQNSANTSPISSTLTLVGSEKNGNPTEEQKKPGLTAHIPVTDLPISDIPSPIARDHQPPSPKHSTIPEKIFAAFNGIPSWKFTRTLTSALPTHPSGTVTGTANFSILPSANLETQSAPLLYSEEGEFVTDTGLRFTARRKYIYTLDSIADEMEPTLSVYFFDDASKDPQKVTGGLFVQMGSLKERAGVWEAGNKEQHLCAEDLYTASWRFGKGMVEGGDEEVWWEVRYDVKGPKKDYVSKTMYVRQ
jgi:tRNA A64-2'-O-ribosylphosphate transferase